VSWNVFWTALVGIAGIIAAFFAPPWTQRKIERRKETREFRAARGLVTHELDLISREVAAVLQRGVRGKFHEPMAARFLSDDRWRANERILAQALPDVVLEQVARVYSIAGVVRIFYVTGESSATTPLTKEQLDLFGQIESTANRAKSMLESAKPLKD
jgi:hypothetical protein